MVDPEVPAQLGAVQLFGCEDRLYPLRGDPTETAAVFRVQQGDIFEIHTDATAKAEEHEFDEGEEADNIA